MRIGKVKRIRNHAKAGNLEATVPGSLMMIYANNEKRLIMYFKSPTKEIPAIMPAIMTMTNTAIEFDIDGSWQITKDRREDDVNVWNTVSNVTGMTLDEIGGVIRDCDEETRMFLKLKGFNL